MKDCKHHKPVKDEKTGAITCGNCGKTLGTNKARADAAQSSDKKES